MVRFRGSRRRRARKPSTRRAAPTGRGRGRPTWSGATPTSRRWWIASTLPPTIPCYVHTCLLAPHPVSTDIWKTSSETCRFQPVSRRSRNKCEAAPVAPSPRLTVHRSRSSTVAGIHEKPGPRWPGLLVTVNGEPSTVNTATEGRCHARSFSRSSSADGSTLMPAPIVEEIVIFLM